MICKCGNHATQFLNNQEAEMAPKTVAEEPTRPPKSPFSFLVDAKLSVEKSTTRTKIRQTHLENNGVDDPYTNRVRDLLESTEETIDGWITEELRKHPAYPWFSRIKGIGNENIAKVVGLVDIHKAPMISSLWRYAGMHVTNVVVAPEQQVEEAEKSLAGLQTKLTELRKKYAKNPEKEAEDIQVLRSGNIGGLAVALQERLGHGLEPVTRGCAPTRSMYKATGTKLDYNSELRVMCFRIAGALLKAGIRNYCTSCGDQRPAKRKDQKETDVVCASCGSKDFESKPNSPYARYYFKAKDEIIRKLQAEGTLIVPTLELPTNGNGKIFEPVGTIATGHVHMRAQRKMSKLFLSHLWLVWRKAEGLPVSKPYAHAILGHAESGLIDPWDMVEKKPAPKPRRKTATV